MKLTIEQIDLVNEQPMVVQLPHGDRFTWTNNVGFDKEELNLLCCTVPNPEDLIPFGYPVNPQINKLTALILLQCCYPNLTVIQGVPLIVDELPLPDDDNEQGFVDWYPYDYKQARTMAPQDQQDVFDDNVDLSYGGEPIELADGKTIMLADWKEEEHPRDAHGRFIAGMGGGTSQTNVRQENRLSQALQGLADNYAYGRQNSEASRRHRILTEQIAEHVVAGGVHGVMARAWKIFENDGDKREELVKAISKNVADYSGTIGAGGDLNLTSDQKRGILQQSLRDIGINEMPRVMLDQTEAKETIKLMLQDVLNVNPDTLSPEQVTRTLQWSRAISGSQDYFITTTQLQQAYNARNNQLAFIGTHNVRADIENEVKRQMGGFYNDLSQGQKQDIKARIDYAIAKSIADGEENKNDANYNLAENLIDTKTGNGELVRSDLSQSKIVSNIMRGENLRVFADPLTGKPVARPEPARAPVEFANRNEMIAGGGRVHEQRGATRGRQNDIVEMNGDLFSIAKDATSGQITLTPLRNTSEIAPYLLDKMLGVTARSTGKIEASVALQNMMERTGQDFLTLHNERKAKARQREANKRKKGKGFRDELSEKVFGNRSNISVVDVQGNSLPANSPELTQFWGREMTAADLADIIGAPDGCRIAVNISGNSCTLSAVTRDLLGTGATVNQNRRFTRESDGSLTCYNSYFRISHPLGELADKKRLHERTLIRHNAGVSTLTGHQKRQIEDKVEQIKRQIDTSVAQGTKNLPSGVGIRIFAKQIESMIRAGVTQLTVSAAGDYGSYDYNGYTTWAKFGYNKTLYGGDKPQGFTSTNLNDLMSEVATTGPWAGKTGAYAWEMTGSGFSGMFDLSEGSKARKVLSEYIKRTNNRASEDLKLDIELSELMRRVRIALAEEEVATQADGTDKNDGFPMSDEDMALLDEIWKDIAAGKVEDDLDNQLAAMGMQDDIYAE